MSTGKKTRLVVLSALLFISFFAVQIIRAQNSDELRWEEVPLQSGEVAEIVISPSNPNIMYAGFEVNSHSLYKSTDAGSTWVRVNGGGDHTKDVAVSPRDPHKAYFAMSEKLETTDRSFRSNARSMFGGPNNDFGETQIILSTSIPPGGSHVSFSSVEVFEGDDAIIYAARKGGGYGPFGNVTPKIYKSTNGGRSWSEVEPNLSDVNVLAIHPQNHNFIIVGSRDGIYSSNDSGATLTKFENLSNNISIEFQLGNPDVIYAASDTNVLKSTDGGSTWQDITGELQDIHRVRVSRSHPNVLYASTFNGIFRSDNGGTSWRDISGNLKSKNIQIVEIHPTNPDIAFIGHSSLWSAVRAEDRYRTGLLAHQGIFKTTDGGRTWARSDNGIKEYNFEEVAVNPTKPHEAWVLSPASRGGYKTEDGGHNWSLTQTPTFHYPMRVKYSLQNPDKIYATGWQNGAPFSYSNDGGVNWTFVNERMFFKGLDRGKHLRGSMGQAIHLHGLTIDPTNDNVIYAGSIHDPDNPVNFLAGAHIFKSTDGGRSWKEMDDGFPHEEHTAIHDIVVDPQHPNTIYAATTEHESEKGIGVYKSTDGGELWSPVNNGFSDEALSVNAIIVSPQDTRMLLAATFGGLYKSDNAGNSWRRTSPASSFDVEYVVDNPNVVYASTDEGVLRSFDFGNSWSAVNTGLPTLSHNQGGSSGGHQHFGAGIGVDKTGQVIYAAFQNAGLYVARLTDVPAQEPTSRFGGSPYDRGPFAPLLYFGFRPWEIAAGVIGILVIGTLIVFLVLKLIRKLRKSAH